jgi:hypothetical protein
MPAKGMEQVRSRLKAVFEEIAGPMTEECLTEIMVIGGGYSDSMTPVALSTLINSRYRKVERTPSGWSGRYGYTAAYAAAVHDKPGVLLGTSTPRSPASLGNVWDNGTGGAEPEFLRKGFERDGIDEIKAAIIRNMTL